MPFKHTLLTLIILVAEAVALQAQTTFKITDGIGDASVKATMENHVSTLIQTFRQAAEAQTKNIRLPREILTKEARESVERMWRSSAMSCPPMNLQSRCLTTATGYQVRGIPVDMLEADSAEARQELTINFTPAGLISDVSVAIDMHRYDVIMAQRESDLDYARRQIIVDFVENFRTAYNRKDINLLNSIYGDNALIITGRVVKEKQGTDRTRMTLNGGRVVYIKQSKQEYLTKLAGVFKRNRFVNVRFEDIEVVQHPKFDDIYGVTLKQFWHTASYSDEGYLFLMVDFRDEHTPVIQVRTWQPYKDAVGKVVTQKKDIFHLGSFRITR